MDNLSGRKPKEAILLDQFSLGDIRKWSRLRDELGGMHWEFFSNLAFQRSKIENQLKSALGTAAIRDYRFKGWQRLVTYQYSDDPLSVDGSLVDPGGRFNIGDIDQARFPVFPALYIAEDKDTALQEALCQSISSADLEKALESALSDTRSISIVSVSGLLERLIDLNQPEKLRAFVDLIKGFKMPKIVIRTAAKYKIPLDLITSVEKLMSALLEPNWRAWAMQFDVPFSSQIFGRLAKDAGIEGIIYPSKFGGKNCIALFPQSFQNTESFIQLDDRPPRRARRTRLDSNNWYESDCAKVPRIDASLVRRIIRTGTLAGMIRNAVSRAFRFWKWGSAVLLAITFV